MDVSIIVNIDALSVDYLPKHLLHREKELQQLMNNIKNRVNCMVLGPVGSGKTTLVKKAILDLTEDIRYVDCTLYDTPFSVLMEVVPSAKLVLQRSIYELIKRLSKEANKKKLWICFDNFVRLKDVGIISKVMSVGVSIVLIGNIAQDAEVLNKNALSNIPCLVKLPDYTVEQSLAILKARAKDALVESAYTKEFLREISERTKGNMALAIGLLRTAALKAQNEGRELIEVADLAEIPYSLNNPSNLGSDERILLEILKERKRLSGGELFELYKEQTGSQRGERSFRNYMEALCAKGLVEATGINRWRKYRLVESTPAKLESAGE